jgi:YD repeat-containing protein
VIKEVKPNRAILEYGYDKVGNRTLQRLKKVVAPDGETIYSYDAVGNCKKVSYANGTYTKYGYDPFNRLTSLETRKPDNSLLASYQPTCYRS